MAQLPARDLAQAMAQAQVLAQPQFHTEALVPASREPRPSPNHGQALNRDCGESVSSVGASPPQAMTTSGAAL